VWASELDLILCEHVFIFVILVILPDQEETRSTPVSIAIIISAK